MQLLVSCGGGRRPVDGLRQQHVHTIRPLVWDTLEDLPPLGLYFIRGTRTARYTHVDELARWTSTLTTIRLQQQGRVQFNVGLYGGLRGGDDGQEENVATPEVHQRGEDVLPLPT